MLRTHFIGCVVVNSLLAHQSGFIDSFGQFCASIGPHFT